MTYGVRVGCMQVDGADGRGDHRRHGHHAEAADAGEPPSIILSDPAAEPLRMFTCVTVLYIK